MILHGRTQVPFSRFRNELRRFGLTEAAAFLAGASNTQTLIQKLHQYALAECNRPHDHIYALLGISSNSGWLHVDYKLHVPQLYCAVAENYMMSGNGIANLMLATAKGIGHDLADWGSRWQHDRSNKQVDVPTTLCRASYHPDDYEKVDTVSSTGSIMCRKLSNHDGILVIRGWTVPRCELEHSHEQVTCRKVRLLRSEGDAT
ncbi:hypothetical protein DOTSEDRAFT_72125 [Dothistroma septosporum NZE10]|uniref:Uncharacterized protein n=1 Tax=Dothistroma septosporum (strain NZE10 / CBS 128990) TaxID=675120 RepID=N1PMD4_DOTSN|nr:hypothetical protein DOTSEDRAFT_72125 [Dothistroma septosporum NZE10]